MKNQKNFLPIENFRQEILTAVRDYAVTIITAETGAGKSTQVPQFLLEAGLSSVVTQPRRLAARTVAERVAEEIGEELGQTVGFRTAVDRKDSEKTRCLFVTDGLALVRELMGAGHHDVLILDEVHEWNINIEVLVAWSKLQIARTSKFRVVVMSATMEAEKMAAYFNGAPVISVPGRLFPIEEKPAGRSMVEDAAELLNQGRNVLVFQPGKTEIGNFIAELSAIPNLSAEVLPLHGELTPAEQAACFRGYYRPKCVVSTNVAQTSVTINDIDAVVDSGMERRVELVDGVEGLYLKAISLADSAQRKGRAGRTKDGIYIDHCPSSDRLDFPKAEILRSRLDQTVLRLAEAGFDAEELEFFHQPAPAEIHEAKRALRALGLMNEVGMVTKMGHRVARMPISVQFGRMVIEAERLGVVGDILSVAAILEQGGITSRFINMPGGGKVDAKPFWQELTGGESESDVLAQLAVYKAAGNMSNEQMKANGVNTKSFYQMKEVRRHLADSLRGTVREFGSSGKREDILRALCSGMVDHLYQNQYGSYRNGDDVDRELARESVLSSTDWLVGLPFDISGVGRRGAYKIRLVTMATKVDPMWLADVAPQLVRVESGLSPKFDEEKDAVVSTTKTFFQDRLIKAEVVEDSSRPDAAQVFCDWLVGKFFWYDSHQNEELAKVIEYNRKLQTLAADLNQRAGQNLFEVKSRDELKDLFLDRLAGATSVATISDFGLLFLPSLDEELVKSVDEMETTKIAEQVAVEELKSQAVQKYSEMQSLYGDYRYNSDIDEDLRTELNTMVYSSLPAGSAELKQWLDQVEQLKVRLTEAIAEAAAKMEAEKLRAQQELEAENNHLLQLAFPMIPADQEPDLQTVYAMPCEEEGFSVDPATAKIWKPFSFWGGKTERFTRHKGYRSTFTGSTIEELIKEFFEGDEDQIDDVLDALENSEYRKKFFGTKEVKTSSTGIASLEDLASAWGAKLKK